MKMKKTSFLLAVLLAFGSVRGQDIHFSQFNETPTHLNPAYTGLFDGLFRVTMNYRSQWASMGSPYKTMAGAFDMPIQFGSGAYIGLGAFLYSDKAGDSQFGTFQGLVSVSGIVPTSDHAKLSVGIQGGYSQRSASISNLQWENQYVNGAYDPTAPSNEANLLTSFPYVDFSAGVAYQYRNVAGHMQGKDVFELQIGGAAYHLSKPNVSFLSGGSTRMDIRYVFHTQVRYDFPKTKWSLRPSAYYMQQGPAYEILLGSLIRYRIKSGTKITNFFSETGIAFGCHYRYKDAILPQMYFDFGDIFIGLSYDMNISKYAQVSKMNGGFEVTLRYANLNGALYKNKK
jgi:type IX secretion system PorP/SprF family membrane protein